MKARVVILARRVHFIYDERYMDTFAAKIIQAAIMYYFHIDKVNNTAEYWGIIHGLLRAEAEHITPLYVVSDSSLII